MKSEKTLEESEVSNDFMDFEASESDNLEVSNDSEKSDTQERSQEDPENKVNPEDSDDLIISIESKMSDGMVTAANELDPLRFEKIALAEEVKNNGVYVSQSSTFIAVALLRLLVFLPWEVTFI